MVDTALLGSFKYASSEGMEGYFKAIGMPYDAEKMAAGPTPTRTISVSGDVWTSVFTRDKATTTTFKLGEEVEVDGSDGQKRKQKNTVEGNKLVSVTTLKDGRQTISKTEFHADGLTTTLEIDGVKATIQFTRT